MNENTYMIGKKDSSPGLGVSLENKAEVYKEANVFCEKKGQIVKTLNITTMPAELGKLGSTELHFSCEPTSEK